MKLDRPVLYALGTLLVGGTALAATITNNGNPASGELTGPHTGKQHALFGEILLETEDEAEGGFDDREWAELCTILADSGLRGKVYVRGRTKDFGAKVGTAGAAAVN